MLTETIEVVENEISSIEADLISKYDPMLSSKLQRKKVELRSYLNERVKGALVKF